MTAATVGSELAALAMALHAIAHAILAIARKLGITRTFSLVVHLGVAAAVAAWAALGSDLGKLIVL